MSDDRHTLLAEELETYGFRPEVAAGLARVVDDLAQMRARSILIAYLQALRGTLYGTALLRALGDVGGESAEQAARRLHTSKRVLLRHQAEIRRTLSPPLVDSAA